MLTSIRNVKFYKNAFEYNVYGRCLCYFLYQVTMAEEQEFIQMLKILVFFFRQLWNILIIIRTSYILSHADINKWAHLGLGDYSSLTLNFHLHFFCIYICVIPLDILHGDWSINRSSSASAPSTSTFVVLPYVRSVPERISRAIRNNGVKVGYKPFNVLRTCFPRPKYKP